MADIKIEEQTSNLDAPSNCVDPLDLEQYINPDKLTFNSPPMSPASSSYKSSSGATSAAPTFLSQSTEQTFSGPSHQYEQYRQQSSLPVGAVANTFALNEANHLNFGHDSYGMLNADKYIGSSNFDDPIDFSGSEFLDLEMDFNASPPPVPALNSSGSSITTPQSYSSSQTSHVRAWPGMHQQAAMQAKAQAEAQAQRQQEMKQQVESSAGPSNSSHQENENSHAEESISRLLNRMRHSSVSSQAEDQSTPGGSGNYLPNSRSRKDEEDMDEDERLLASEEGKKLSSKERRQLRNKVSARAFRSRRKEYIGQLEGEIAARTSEAERLRLRNDQLAAENKRLTDLTRMLLSSPHFSTFLDDLSANRGSMPSLPQGLTQPDASQLQQLGSQPSGPKDVNAASHQQASSGTLAMIPESPFEYDRQPSNNGTWIQNNNSITYDQPVYAITSIPDEPVIEMSSLSGKSLIEPLSSFGSIKEDGPAIEAVSERKSISLSYPPTLFNAEAEEAEDLDSGSTDDLTFDASDPAFALYAQEAHIPSPTSTALAAVDPEDRIFGDIALEKALGRIEIAVRGSNNDEEQSNAAAIDRFERLRCHMDSLGARIDAVTGGL